MTYEEVIELLSKDRRVNLNEFGRDGWRSLEELLAEINADDVRPVFNTATGTIDIVRFSAKGILKSEGYQLHEVLRKYPKQKRLFGLFRRWRVVRKFQEYALSESMRLGSETSFDALRRGAWEEWRVRIRDDQIKVLRFLDGLKKHPSTVYPRLPSNVKAEWCEITLLKRPCRYNPVVIDNGMLIYLQWFYLNGKEPWYRIWERKFLTFLIRTYVLIRYSF